MARLIIAAGMRRSGSTLQYQMLQDVLSEAGIAHEAFLKPKVSQSDLDAAHASSGVLIFKTHQIPDVLPEALEATGTVVFYSSRDPRDCVTSYLRKYGKSATPERACRFTDTLRQEFDFWTAPPIAHWTRYEMAIPDPQGEVHALARALGCDLDAVGLQRIVDRRSMEAQRQLIASIDWDREARELGEDRVDPDSLLHSNHIHEGEIGGWRRELPADVVVAVEERFGDFIRRAGYEISTGPLARFKHRAMRGVHWLLRGMTR